MVAPSLEGLLEGRQKPLGLGQAMAPLAQPLDQLDLMADPHLALGDVAIRLSEVLPFGGKVKHGCADWRCSPFWSRPFGMGQTSLVGFSLAESNLMEH